MKFGAINKWTWKMAYSMVRWRRRHNPSIMSPSEIPQRLLIAIDYALDKGIE